MDAPTDRIAHVFVDLVSLVDDDTEESDDLAAQIELAAQRAFDLDGILVRSDEDGSHLDVTNLMAGAASALAALMLVALDHGDLSHDGLIHAWRQQIDTPGQ